ncbi:tetratricopeptide repeat protein [Bacillus sonorensis]|uniref:Response regulator aspartate phosphatase RapA n=2 Tax=Bacillus sonorensis TaxID=119858 RepID=M5PAK9_9BACI|nr:MULTISPECIES: Rap family tetratricopeptide repeat protein [Bacillus]ASB88637.1 Response regulator aspartate phosphatase [Bacillus sonorensis]EME76553.1 response regulator aspartate phosphatase RapA [Bacillus sonorensis L12]MBG9915548.1 aspartate phosphatase [Bacillus sonorensis]MCY8405120.1 tetratricopeptide repeat protein [Bacillus sonorensis]MCZ0067665.1 tetratricopeptide repeat protein [Bacillus sonorensis]
MSVKIPSASVGVKINEWYNAIRKFNVTDAEMLKAEIERELSKMEEDQDLLLYYALMEFRHRIMLDYIKPLEDGEVPPDFSKILKDIEDNQDQLTGLLEYYFNFFRGMYEYRHHDYIKAISFYRRAEKKLLHVEDEIERAEFHFKMAEVFYQMRQSHVSMNYALQAIQTYQAHETYTVRRIQCEFVIAGNYDDLESNEKALPHLEKALKLAQKEDQRILEGHTFYNLGNCYEKMGHGGKAAEYFHQAIEIYKEEKSDILSKAMFSLAHVYFKQKQYKHANDIFNKGIKTAQQLNDMIYIAKFRFLKALYVDDDGMNSILETFHLLESKKMYPDIEDLALEAAEYYNEIGRLSDSVYFYQIVFSARKKMKKGDWSYEV